MSAPVRYRAQEGATTSVRADNRGAGASAGPAGPAPIPILLYHSVCKDPSADLARWSVTPDAFARQLDILVELGCTALTVSELATRLATGSELPERLCLVTFDDGYSDFAAEALPRLVERRLPSTLYLTTGALGGVADPVVPRMPIAPMLALDQLDELEAGGVEIGAHSHSHRQLDAVPVRLAAREITRSKQVLEEALGHAVASFAYPHGYSSPAVRHLVAAAGFRSATAVRNAFSSVSDDLFALARLTVERTTPMTTVRAWIGGSGARVAGPGESVQTQLWRWYRRAAAMRERPNQRLQTVPAR